MTAEETGERMTTPITQIPKPEAGQFREGRKLFLVPTVPLPPQLPEDGQTLLERFWSEVRDQVEGLERSLGKIKHVFHEALHVGGEEGIGLLEQVNPQGSSFIQAMCHSYARLEPTEDLDALEQITDWQRCLSIGLMSRVVQTTAVDGFRDATDRRYEHIAARVDEAIGDGEAGVIFISEDHGVQFPADVQVFYVAPPALDRLKRWAEDWMRAPAPAVDEEPQTSDEVEEKPEAR